MFVRLNCSVTQLVPICVNVFLTDVRDCYVLTADSVCFYCLDLSKFSIVILLFYFVCYVLYCTIGMI